jgi:hypothetical protein
MQVQPFLAKDGVPSPSDELVNDNQDPHRQMINLVGHQAA